MAAAERAWFWIIVAGATLLRFRINDVGSYSPADESVYVELSRRLAEGGFLSTYPAIAREWIADADWWRYPSPLRCGYLALTTFAMQLVDSTHPRVLAWISTLAGIAVVPLLFSLARRVADTRTALLAAAFAAVSPIELAMGRRALQDQVLCAAVLLAFFAVVRMLDDEAHPRARTAIAIAALTFALSIKETVLFIFPALAIFVWLDLRPRRPGLRHAALFVVPPLLLWALLASLSRDPEMPYRTARLVAGAMTAPYVVQYQSGPPHRVLLDYLIVAPLVSALACGALALISSEPSVSRRTRALAAFVVLGFSTFALVASKNLRFTIMLDPLVRLLAAWIVVSPHHHLARRTSTIAAFAVMNVAIELELFHTIFITGGVYDPVTHTMLEALGAVPRDATSAPPPMLWPWICAVIASASWLFSRMRPGASPSAAAPAAASHQTG